MNVKRDVNSNLVKYTKKCQIQPPHYKQTISLICNCPPSPFFCALLDCFFLPFRVFLVLAHILRVSFA